MANIFIRTNIAPYRVDTYNALHEQLGMKMCFYEREGKAQKFDIDALEAQCSFKPVYLKGLTFGSMNRKWCFGLWKMLRKEKPEVVIVPEFQISAMQVLLYRWLTRKRFKVVSMTDDSYDMIANDNDFTKLHKWLRDHLAKYFDNFIVVTPQVERWYQEYYGKGVWMPIIMNGRKAAMTPYGVTFKRSAGTTVLRDGKKYWTAPYSEFALNDMVTDVKGNEIPLREEVKQVTGDIEKVQEFKSSRVQDIWKFQIDLPDLTEEECKDFYVLMTRDWTSARHKVVMVEDGWLYYHLDSEDLHSDRDPNVDWKQYRVRPRYRLINSPVSQGVHVTGGRIYVPWQYKEVRVNKGGHLITFAYCHFNSLEICNFTLKGSGGDTGIGIYSSTFEQGALIRHNTFRNLSGKAVSTAINRNVMIADNDVTYTRQQAIEAGGTHTAVCRNHLKNIGWMLNTRAITGGGEGMHICDNVIEDFNYSAIAVGSTTPNEKAGTLTYIIERNTIRLTEAFTDNYIQNTLADGGGIYIGPQCTQGIIRNNVVENIKGIHSNRGIFLDDGAKNLAIYGNLIMNTANSYDIDLRLSNGYAAGIPDHNTNNSVFQNILTGGYRFQDGGAGSNCIGGENVLLGTGAAQKTVVELKRRAADVEVQGSEAAGSRVQSSRVQSILDSMPVDGFVNKQIKY